MAPTRETIWFIGKARDSELRFCLREMEAVSRGRSIELFAAIDDVDPDGRPDIVVVLQDWSQQFRETEINRLLSITMPGGRVLVVYGSWCESDGRNTDLWPHGVRVAARNAAERFERELRELACNGPSLPLTASRDERFEHNHSASPPESLRRVSAYVDSSDRHLRESLAERLRRGGVDVQKDSRVCDAILWAPGLDGLMAASQFAQKHRGRRVVAITEMPTAAHRDVLAESGIVDLVPMLVTDRQLLKSLVAR